MRLFIVTLFCIGCISKFYATNHALLIGIGRYPTSETGWKQIHGDADVRLLEPAFRSHGFADVKTLVNCQATKSNIVSELKKLHERCKSGENVYIHFSGHGQLVVDLNGDELSGCDEAIVPYDAYRTSRTPSGRYYNGSNHLIDDELTVLLNNIKQKIGKDGRICLVIDACYSRGIERDEELNIDDDDILNSIRGTDIVFRPVSDSAYLRSIPKPGYFSQGGYLYVLTACLETERNFECKTAQGKMYGSLSYYIYILLKRGAVFSEWVNCMQKQEYKRFRVFQPFQHPSIKIYN